MSSAFSLSGTFLRLTGSPAESGEPTISNDGATIMRMLDIVHPAAQTLVDIARSQDEVRWECRAGARRC